MHLMKSTLIPYNSAAAMAELVCAILKTRGFQILDNGSVSKAINAMKDGVPGKRKDIHIQIIESSAKQIWLEVSVRNLGLELQRDRNNDLLEVKVIRDIHRIVYKKSQPRRLALSA